MELKPTDKVYLKQRYIKEGNVFFQGHYKVAELPKAVLNEEYINVIGQESLPQNYQSALKKQVIEITSTAPATKQVSYPASNPKSPPEKPLTPSIKLNVNSATAEEIAKLKNVSMAIATKIIEARNKKPFVDIEDLKSRIKLNRGSWDDIQSNLLY